MIGFLKNKLVYHKFQAVSKGSALDPYNLKDPWYQKWNQLMIDYRSRAPKGLESIEQNNEDLWAWMITERAFVTSAF